MQSPKYPYPNKDYIVLSQGYIPGKHWGHDIVPMNTQWVGWPAPCYPVFSGRTMSVANTDKDRGKGIRVRTILWPDIIEYLKAEGVFPQDKNEGWVDILYWHFLDVTDLDTYINQGTPVGITGNTGNVWHGGVQVDDSQKGVPPYLGLHLHLETVLGSGTEVLNKNIDAWGRIDPNYILNYKPKFMSNVGLVKKGGEYAFYVPVTNSNALISQALNYGIEIPTTIEGKVDFVKLETMLIGQVIK